jgi:hypothetical protein
MATIVMNHAMAVYQIHVTGRMVHVQIRQGVILDGSTVIKSVMKVYIKLFYFYKVNAWIM